MGIEFDNAAVYEQVERQPAMDNLGMDGFCSEWKRRCSFDEGREGVTVGCDAMSEHMTEYY